MCNSWGVENYKKVLDYKSKPIVIPKDIDDRLEALKVDEKTVRACAGSLKRWVTKRKGKIIHNIDTFLCSSWGGCSMCPVVVDFPWST